MKTMHTVTLTGDESDLLVSILGDALSDAKERALDAQQNDRPRHKSLEALVAAIQKLMNKVG